VIWCLHSTITRGMVN